MTLHYINQSKLLKPMQKIIKNFVVVAALLLILICPSFSAFAQASSIPTLDSGDTAWMLVSTLLVLMMTLPGLSLFYGGIVHKDSVLATMMQSFVSATTVSVLWVVFGYSLVFTEHNSLIGGFNRLLLAGIGKTSLHG